ncbi:MAG: lipopolysaccharide biosynthesis protein RfbH [Muribaculaceae bacterium]|nr:lipopolysaccharide biosynthesis protein RfbH [Muribaculaceae bacterium]
MEEQERLKEEILALTAKYYTLVHATSEDFFIPDRDSIRYGGRVFNENELKNLISSSLDFWLTAGAWANKFEKDFAKWLNVKYVSLTNSGSSANLLAFFALTSPLLKEKAIKRGDEVITVACAFPTTVSPIMQFGAVPVFVDIDLDTYNIDCSYLEKALSPKTKAVVLAHSLGNPFNVEAVYKFCQKHSLWLIEDNCDALGADASVGGITKKTGTWGHIGTSSFYPAHHLTMGEGGAVYTNDPLLNKIVRSFRDWGRDCNCSAGVDNSCGCRFSGTFGNLPVGYDHKYVYSHMGFNLKITDMQAAIGCAQLEKLDYFVEKRRENFKKLSDGLDNIAWLQLPKAEKNTNPSWFGFAITIKPGAPFTRNRLTSYLEKRKIQTRTMFAGNLIKHPAFDQFMPGSDFRVIGELKNTDYVLENTFWIGVYPGLTDKMVAFIIEAIRQFVSDFL